MVYMKIKKITTEMRFKDEKGVYGFAENQYALYVDGKGYVSLDNGQSPYCPIGGEKALQSILNQGGFVGEVSYIQPIKC